MQSQSGLKARSVCALLRWATPDDIETVATIWQRGWLDSHLGHVPAALHAYRTRAALVQRVRWSLARTTVAVTSGHVVGFVVVTDDEVEQIYVLRSAYGTGIAGILLDHAEHVIAQRSDAAWLAVVAGNIRARRFYERHGWLDVGPFSYTPKTADGAIVVPALRYTKRVGAGLRTSTG